MDNGWFVNEGKTNRRNVFWVICVFFKLLKCSKETKIAKEKNHYKKLKKSNSTNQIFINY